MSAVPHGRMELEVCCDSGVVVRVLKLPIALQQGLEPHEVRELTGFGRLPRGFFLEEDAHVIDLNDLLRVYLWNLQTPSYPLKETLVLESRQRLPYRCTGDAEAFS